MDTPRLIQSAQPSSMNMQGLPLGGDCPLLYLIFLRLITKTAHNVPLISPKHITWQVGVLWAAAAAAAGQRPQLPAGGRRRGGSRQRAAGGGDAAAGRSSVAGAGGGLEQRRRGGGGGARQASGRRWVPAGPRAGRRRPAHGAGATLRQRLRQLGRWASNNTGSISNVPYLPSVSVSAIGVACCCPYVCPYTAQVRRGPSCNI